MADVRPFSGIRYNPDKVKDLSRVVTQPYDKITTEMQARYLQTDPFNFVRLILPKADTRPDAPDSPTDPYTASARTLEEWLDSGVLMRDPAPAIYVLEEEFETDGSKRTRRGFVAAVRVDEFDKGTVLPHEFTLSKPKADRLNLLRATRADYEQIFMLYSDPEREIETLLRPEGAPLMAATDEYGVTHRMWAIADPRRLRRVSELMAGKVLLIADGHHRYETALTYRQEMERAGTVHADAALRFKTAAFVNIADLGLLILPTHRLLFGLPGFTPDVLKQQLAEYFTVTAVTPDKAQDELTRNKNGHAFIAYAGKDACFLVRLKDKLALDRFVAQDRSADYRELDVVVLHAVIIEGLLGIARDRIEDHVRYERYWNKTLERVDSAENQVAFLMNPTRPEQVQALAAKGERMPQKSTDFYPKLISGMVFMDVAHNQNLSSA
uniref:DUF1015 domain-containing protein n=1 Tax=candidate division WOR-3 bacterium TaxID=2052148 RepID=A0A7C4CD91_UNCW3